MDTSKLCAVFLDIDGTLMCSLPEVLEENLRVINRVRQLGHKVFISTGRATSFLPPKLKLEENFDGVIAASGGYVRLGSTELAKHLVPFDATEKLCRYFIENNLPGILEGEINMYYFSDTWYEGSDWIRLDEKTVSDHISKDTPISKFSVDGIVPRELAELLGDEYTVLQHRDYAEIILSGCSKAVGIEAIISELGISGEQTIAIGDSLNDMEMIKYAGIGVAMGNAVDEIKAAADMITKHVNRAGVARALEKIFNL